MRAQSCPTCGQPADPAQPCPHCGAEPGDFAAELALVEREIAELAAKDVAMQKERTLISRRMQAAMHRKALLANAQDERTRHAGVRPPRPPRAAPGRSNADSGGRRADDATLTDRENELVQRSERRYQFAQRTDASAVGRSPSTRRPAYGRAGFLGSLLRALGLARPTRTAVRARTVADLEHAAQELNLEAARFMRDLTNGLRNQPPPGKERS
jgi:hypothetical protein